MSYRARESFLAVRYGTGQVHHHQSGAIIVLQSEVHPSGLVSVLYNDQIVAVFIRDVEARAVPVEASVAW